MIYRSQEAAVGKGWWEERLGACGTWGGGGRFPG